MTTETDFVAALLKDVPRHDAYDVMMTLDGHPLPGGCALGKWVRHADVLAALTAALDPAIAERAGVHLLHLRDDLGPWSKQSADLITALLAQNAALRAERDDAVIKRAAWELEAKTQQSRAEAAEAKVKRLRAERDDALTFLDNAVSKAPEPLKDLGKYLAGRLDEDEWPTAEQYLNAAAKACADRAALSATTEEGHA